ncbi:MAG: bifunctional diaminohydroxyphosphoribosylaminopyrimidine deaminase/5-amino-6-(5-phosphoribosylamino)uracil reductase RibD [Candidatus Sumerlaeaceae bacterium]
MADFTQADHDYMHRALELARQGTGMTSPNPLVGAVVVKRGRIRGEGYHRQVGLPHAEVEALAKVRDADAAGSTLYVTLEPCIHHGRTPPCIDLIVAKKIGRVVVPHSDPNPMVAGKGFRALRKAGIQVDVGLMEPEARRLNEAFITFHTLQRPFMIAKWAMTLDGRIAAESGQSKWITNEKSRTYVHEVRACVDAVMVGIGTVLQDNPMLNVRLTDYNRRQPKRVIVDGHLRIPVRAKCLELGHLGECILATTEAAPPDKIARLEDAGHIVLQMKGRRGLIDMKELILGLHRYEIQSVLCEGGSSMHGSLLREKLVDKVIAFVAPKLIGGDNAKRPVTGWELPAMGKALALEDVVIRTFDDDICVEGYVPEAYRSLKPLSVARRQSKRRAELHDE